MIRSIDAARQGSNCALPCAIDSFCWCAYCWMDSLSARCRGVFVGCLRSAKGLGAFHHHFEACAFGSHAAAAMVNRALFSYRFGSFQLNSRVPIESLAMMRSCVLRRLRRPRDLLDNGPRRHRLQSRSMGRNGRRVITLSPPDLLFWVRATDPPAVFPVGRFPQVGQMTFRWIDSIIQTRPAPQSNRIELNHVERAASVE